MSEAGIPTLEAFLASSTNNTDIELNDEPCAICLEPLVILVEENRPLVLPTLSCSAGHTYHYHCLHMELIDMQPEDEPKDCCPMCRRRLFADLECIREVYSWFVTRCMVWKMLWAPESTSEPAVPSLGTERNAIPCTSKIRARHQSCLFPAIQDDDAETGGVAGRCVRHIA